MDVAECKHINHYAKTLPGVDLLSLDGLRAVRCLDSVTFPEVRRFLRVAKWVCKVGQMLVRTCHHGLFWRDGMEAYVDIFGECRHIYVLRPTG